MKKLALSLAILAIATSAYAKDWSTVRFGVDQLQQGFRLSHSSGCQTES